jgi:hypothetical protein
MEIKPCPFCGAPGMSAQHPQLQSYFAGCVDEGCIAHLIAYDFVTQEAAITAWNMRAVDRPSDLTFAQIEGAFPEGATVTDEGIVNVTPQWLHDFAHNLASLERPSVALSADQVDLCRKLTLDYAIASFAAMDSRAALSPDSVVKRLEELKSLPLDASVITGAGDRPSQRTRDALQKAWEFINAHAVPDAEYDEIVICIQNALNAPERPFQDNKDMRPCYSCGKPAHEHGMKPDPRGGMRVGDCPTGDRSPHAKWYAALRSMHWNDGKLAVIDARNLSLGVQTYSGDMLDAAIEQAIKASARPSKAEGT